MNFGKTHKKEPRRLFSKRPAPEEFLPDLQLIAEKAPSRTAPLLIAIVTIFVGCAIGWASIGKVDRVVTSSGIVRPAGQAKVINHPHGGEVERLFVKAGDAVTRGKPLIRFSEELVDAQISRITQRLDRLAGRIARLRAETNGRAPDFPADLSPEVVEIETNLYRSRQRALSVRRLQADREIERYSAMVEGLRDRMPSIEEEVRIYRRQDSAIAALANAGHFPRLRYLTIQRERVQSEGRMAELQQQLNSARSALARTYDERRRVDEDWQANLFEELAETLAERSRLRGEMAVLEVRRRNLLVNSPVDGIVEELIVRSEGQVVAPNDPIMRIVPTASGLVIEGRVSDSNIGFIDVGQDAEVRVRTYDFARYGSLQGRVTRVSADATRDPDTDRLYFLVVVESESSHLTDGERQLPVRPGMSVDISFNLGRRTIVSYFIDRFVRTGRTVFRER